MSEGTERLSSALADRYQILSRLGEGGMATVYLAEDLKHKRQVAVKVLKPELAAVLGAERFVQEITTTASLQHPHILPLFDSGEADSFLYYVMPYIEGETLRAKLDRETQLGIDEAVKITTEVADALDYAHRHGVIHRDIKPENILLHDGRPMVADFGIALAVSAAAGGRMTETGLSLGTPHYMSPEQATAEKEITVRSDVYSLGAVLYEMLTGHPPHVGSTAQQIIMMIVTDEARPITELRKSVPQHIADAVATALEKLPADRFESAAGFSQALVNPGFVRKSVAAVTRAASARHTDRRLLALTAALVVALGAAAWGWLRPTPKPMVSRFAMAIPPEQQHRILTGQTLAISPDGSRIAYYGPAESGNQLWLRALDDLNAVPIPGTDGAAAPFFSPDGKSVAFYRRPTPSTLYTVSLDGGPPLALMDGLTYHGSWGSDGYLYVVTTHNPRNLARLRASGGPLEILLQADTVSNRQYHNPHVLPNGRGVLFGSCSPYPRDCVIRLLDLESGEDREIVSDSWRGRYISPGYLVYSRMDGVLLAAPFDQDRFQMTGPSTPLLEGMLLHVGGPDFDISRNGTLVYLAGTAQDAQLAWMRRDGTEQTLDATFRHPFSSLALSPDGGRIALSIQGEPDEDLWVYDIDQATLSRLSFEGESNQRAAWSPDGQRLTYISNATGQEALHTISADGSSPGELLLQLERPIWEGTWSRDGQWLVLRSGPNPETMRDIEYVRVGVDTTTRTFLATEFDELNPELSPDGRWLAYVSDESGRDEVYVRPFPGPGGRWQISTDGGTEPLWAHNGHELFYRSPDNWLVRAEVTTGGASFSVGARTPLFSAAQFARDPTHTHYDISPDDSRFLMIRPSEASHRIVVVLNWLTELKERVRGGQ